MITEQRVMRALRREQRELSKLASRKPPAEVLPEVQRFMDGCVAAGKLLAAPGDRRIVRGFIQYWATYRYRHTGHYDLPDLDAPEKPLQHIIARSASEIAVASDRTVEKPRRLRGWRGVYLLLLPNVSLAELQSVETAVQAVGGSLRPAKVRLGKDGGARPAHS